MTRTIQSEEMVEQHAHCIVGCGWADEDLQASHPEYCERAVGNHAIAVTEQGWIPTQFWCSVIASHLHGTFTQSYSRQSDRYRNGVQLATSVQSEAVIFETDAGGGWRELKFHLSAGEARQLAAQLVAAADSHDHIDQDGHIMRRLEKIAKHVGADIWGA